MDSGVVFWGDKAELRRITDAVEGTGAQTQMFEREVGGWTLHVNFAGAEVSELRLEIIRLRAEVVELRRAAADEPSRAGQETGLGGPRRVDDLDVAEAMLTNLRDADQPPGGRPAGGAREAGHIRSPWESCTCVIFGTAYDVGELDPVCPRHGAGRSPAAGAAPADYLDYLDSSYEVPPPSMCDATLISERDRVLFECDLRRGHDGPHTDKGCRWTTLPPTAPVPDPEAIDRAAREAVRAFNADRLQVALLDDPEWWAYAGPSWHRVARAVAAELGLPAPEKETGDE